MNSSQLAHTVSIVTGDGSVLVKGSVPVLNKQPPVWRVVKADISRQEIVVTVDGHTNKMAVAADTVELVLDVGASEQAISQHAQQLQWR